MMTGRMWPDIGSCGCMPAVNVDTISSAAGRRCRSPRARASSACGVREALVDARALAGEREAVRTVEVEEPAAERSLGQRAERAVARGERGIGAVAVGQDLGVLRARSSRAR